MGRKGVGGLAAAGELAVTVYLVGAGPGDPSLITVRGADVLRRADVVAYDRLVDRALLELAPQTAELVDVGKEPGTPRSQSEVSALLVELGRKHATVVRLKGGDPFLFGRGGEEVEALLDAGIAVEVVPGVTSAFAAPAYAGVAVTHRGISTSVTVVTGHVGDPAGGAGGDVGDPRAFRGVDWESLARARGTIVILMGMAKRSEIAERLIAGGRPGSTPVAVVQWGTTPMQRSARTTLSELGDVELGSPATIVVGDVAGLELDWLDPIARFPLAGWTVVVTRPEHRADGLVSALRESGASVVRLPSIEIAGPSDGGAGFARALESVGRYDWVAFTSANAASAFVAALPDARALAGVRLAAVGRATARALETAHLRPDLVAGEAEAQEGGTASAAGLVDAMGSPAVSDGGDGARVLFCRAAEALPTLAEGLRASGWSVDEVETYRTIVADPDHGADSVAVERARSADAVVFASPSAVRGFLALMSGAPDSGVRGPLRMVAICIGETTASRARAEGFERVAVASSPTDDGLLEAIGLARGVNRQPRA